MRLNRTYMGTISMTPRRDVMAGEFSTWTFTFTAGEYGIDDGGSLVLAWKSVSDWDTPQFDEPGQPGYTTVSTDGDCRVKAAYHKFVRSFGNSILINVYGGYIKKGDTITITMGDTSQGSLGMRAQSFCEREHEFRTYLDPCGTNRYEELLDRLSIRIVPAMHHELQVVVPGTVEKNKPFTMHLRVLDEFGNPTGKYEGDVSLILIQGEGKNIPRKIHFPSNTDGIFAIPDCRITKEGFWTVRAEDKKRGYIACSNGSCCINPGGPHLYWGDMHGQTRQTVGTGRLDDYYSFARDKALIDFTGWQGNDFEVTNDTWEKIRRFTKEFNRENQFLVYLGYEWSGTTPQGGDHNVYFLHDNDVFYPSSNWSAPGCDVSLNANPIPQLYQKLNHRRDVLLIPHVGGRYANLDFLNPEYTSVIEIHSHHGTFEWFAMDAMKKRLKVGFIAASDDHTGRIGLSYPLSGHGKSASGAFDVASGHTGVFAKHLTREEIWDAIKARHCFASTMDRIFLSTAVNSVEMGDEGTIHEQPVFHVKVAAAYPIESIQIFDWEKPIYFEELLPKANNRIRIRWSGVQYRGRGKSAKWDGMIYVQHGKIVNAETYAFDRIDQGITIRSDQYVKFTSSTSGDYDGLILELEGDDDTVIKFSSLQGAAEASWKEIRTKGIVKPMGGLNLKVEMQEAFEEVPEKDYARAIYLNKVISLPLEKGEHAYWIKVLQTNGNAAWSSPVFVTIN